MERDRELAIGIDTEKCRQDRKWGQRRKLRLTMR